VAEPRSSGLNDDDEQGPYKLFPPARNPERSVALVVVECCPACGRGKMVQRTNRRDRSSFLGCSEYPRCKFTEPFDARVHRLVERIAELEQSLATTAPPMLPALAESRRDIVALTHPDRHRGDCQPLALEATKRLNALRDEASSA